jgi:hypothetical protein
VDHGEQSEAHVLIECGATAETRSEDRDHNTIAKLLWTEKGIETALKIWKRFTNGDMREEGDTRMEGRKGEKWDMDGED